MKLALKVDMSCDLTQETRAHPIISLQRIKLKDNTDTLYQPPYMSTKVASNMPFPRIEALSPNEMEIKNST